MTINILGAEYEIKRENQLENMNLKEVDGYCDPSVKEIVVIDEPLGGTCNQQNLDAVRQRQIRHEIVHAFLSESGLMENSWAENEEIVDWIAAQGLKIYKAWQEAGAV